MIERTERGLVARSQTTVVEFEGIRLVSVRDAASGEEFLERASAEKVPGFELLRQNDKNAGLGVHPLASRVTYHLLAENIAEVLLNDWECDVSLRLSVDEATGDILVEPSAWTMQGGVAGIAWRVAGLRRDLQVVAPLQQGARLPPAHPQIAGKLAQWAFDWEAGFVVFEDSSEKETERKGFTVQAWDERLLFKGIRVGHEACPASVAFITYATGPWEQNRAVGNLCWRISTFRGGWRVPVRRYREWYWRAFRLDEAARMRPDWLGDLRLAVSWCPSEPALLEALAKKVDPRKVFLHVPNWRTHKYDQDYPDYTPSPEGAAFIRKARELGFHTAPHANSCQMSPDHPLFFAARDFCTRSPGDLRWGGWSWLPVQGWGAFGPPQSYSLMPANKDWNVLVNVHLGWSPWRRELTRQAAGLIRELDLDSLFVDVSQLIHNSDNGLVEGLTYPQGSLKLIRELAELAPHFCVSGESRNEVSTQFLSITQFHLYNFAHVHAIDGEDVSWVVECTAPVNEELFNGLTRGIGYAYGEGSNRRAMIDAQLKQGAIPTIIFQSSDPVSELEGEECRYILAQAGF
jgi:hypothetical protein